MTTVRAYAAFSATGPLGTHTVERREPGPQDVVIDILFCGICHSDIHQAARRVGQAIFPMVPGHEIVGRVTRVGAQVTRFKVGDLVGVGCMVDSCRTCDACAPDLEQFCQKGAAFTYNGTEMDRTTPTFGGYSTPIVVDEAFVLKVPETLDPAGGRAAAVRRHHHLLAAAPVELQAGRPRRRRRPRRPRPHGRQARASMGAEVTVLSTSQAKEADAKRLGAPDFALTSDEATFKQLAGHFDLIIDTISAPHDYNAYLGLLRPQGTMVLVGVPPEPDAGVGVLPDLRQQAPGRLAHRRHRRDPGDARLLRRARHRLRRRGHPADRKINEAYERMLKGDVRYRFVIDLASLKGA